MRLMKHYVSLKNRLSNHTPGEGLTYRKKGNCLRMSCDLTRRGRPSKSTRNVVIAHSGGLYNLDPLGWDNCYTIVNVCRRVSDGRSSWGRQINDPGWNVVWKVEKNTLFMTTDMSLEGPLSKSRKSWTIGSSRGPYAFDPVNLPEFFAICQVCRRVPAHMLIDLKGLLNAQGICGGEDLG